MKTIYNLQKKQQTKKYFIRKDISSYKGDKTIVTLADQEINSYLIKRVKEKFPTHSVDGEEEHK